MKLERLPEYITIVITIACGMFLALYVGMSAGTGSNQPLMLIGGILAVMLALILRANIWLLIPLCGTLYGRIGGIPGDFDVRQLTVFYVFAVYLTLKALKVVRTKPLYDWLDYLLLINLAYLLTVYIRNPVGTRTMGLEKIGGKPYVEVVIALLGYWVFNHVTIPSKLAMRLPFLMILGSLFTTSVSLLCKLVPALTPVLSQIYSGFGAVQAEDPSSPSPADDSSISRESEWQGAGTGILKALSSYFPPLSTLNPLHIVRFLLTILACAAILKAGFRSVFIGWGFFFMLASYFREGLASMMRIPALIVPLVCLLLVSHGTLFELPLNMQRTLSFLPGKWDPIAEMNAQESNEWRLEIWKTVWNSGDKYIKNWWFGDGFGMTQSDFREAMQAGSTGQENLTVAGDYHSLPLTTIHTVGYVGLTLFMIQMSGMTYYAWKLIQRAAGTPYFPLALFVGIPVIYQIIYGPLIFGAFKSAAPDCVYAIAWLRLISRSLDADCSKSKEESVKSEAFFPELEFPRFSRPPVS
ncbi:MAG: O-antigen ligase family protein [Verrucomicrobiota bacterium]